MSTVWIGKSAWVKFLKVILEKKAFGVGSSIILKPRKMTHKYSFVADRHSFFVCRSKKIPNLKSN